MRASIYTRLSLDRHGDELAVQRQEEDCRKIIEERGWTLTEVYSDNSISAYDARKKRPAYERLRTDFRAGKFEALVCWDLDRLTRQPRQLEDWIEAAEDQGLALVTATGEADLTTHSGRLFARLKASVARNESEQKSARQKRAALQRAQQGRAWGPLRRFGFQADGSHDPVEAAVIRDMYADYLAGVSQHELARRLNAAGIQTLTGGRWKQATVRQLLRNPRNAALAAYREELTGGAAQWEPIVSRETWETAVALMDKSGEKVPPGAKSAKYLLTGVARCGVCDRTMTSKNRASRVRYYTCPAHHLSRRADRVEQLVTKTVLQYLAKFDFPVSATADNPDRSSLLVEADALRNRKEQLGVDFADGELDSAQLRAANQRIEEKLHLINAKLADSAQTAAIGDLLGKKDLPAAWDQLPMERRRNIVKALTEVTVLPTTPGPNFDPSHVLIRQKRD